MPLRKDGAVGEKEASFAQEIAKAATTTRSRPRLGVLFIDPPEQGLVRNTCACGVRSRYLVLYEPDATNPGSLDPS
jgi:hypothetical protein